MHLCSSWYSYHSCCLLALSEVSLFVRAGATDLSSAPRRAFIHCKSDAAETAFPCPEKKFFLIHICWLFSLFYYYYFLRSVFTEMCISLGLSTGSLYAVFLPSQSILGKTANFPSLWGRGSPHPTGATHNIALNTILAA